MNNQGDSLESLAMPSFAAATGTRTTTLASSISTTIRQTTRTTISVSVDPKISRLDIEHAHEKQTILGRESPEESSKARQYAKPKTATGLKSAVAGSGKDSLFTRLTSLQNLHMCWLKAKRNKSKSLRVQRFGDDPLRYLVIIQERLRNGDYSFGEYKSFIVREKKFRHVVDAPMKDRIVHWMLYDYLLPIWQPRFIHDTYGNLPARGTHAAVNRLAKFCRGADATWCLQLDISKYFYSVNHELLKARALRFIGDQKLRALILQLIDSFQTDSLYDELFPADGIYRTTKKKGMPIGNLSSQIFANIFLNDFDHWVKEDLRIRKYIRYVDDMVILADTKEELCAIRDKIVQKLALDGLTIHPKKIRLAPTSSGIPFLGYVVWQNHISAGKYVRGRYLHRLRQHECQGYDRSEALAAYASMFKHTGSTIYKEAV